MQKYFNNVFNRNGVPIVATTVSVYTYGTTTLAPIFSDSGGTISKPNPITTDGNGYFEFYAADGRYSINTYAAGYVDSTFTDILLEDPSDGVAGGPSSFTTLVVGSTGAPTAGVALDVQSTTGGVKLPSMTTAQKDALANVGGNLVWDSTLAAAQINNGTVWASVGGGGGITGTTNTNVSTLGTGIATFGGTPQGIVIGPSAGASLTSASPIGVMAIGKSSLNLWNTNGNITAVGHQTGRVKIAGSGCTYLGYNVGFNDTRSSESTMVGSEAFGIGNSSTQSVGVGTRALQCLPVPTAGNALIVGRVYTITTVGDANFVTAGAATNTVGTTFVATTTGNGTTGQVEGQSLNNTAIGWEANRNVSGGTNNVSVGYRALNAATSASNMVAIGSNALAIVTGITNFPSVAIGSNALAAATDANQNTVIGTSAAALTPFAAQCTIMGYGALSAATGNLTGVTAYGFNAAINYNSPIGVTAFGSNAAAAKTSGSGGTYLGSSAGGDIASTNATAVGASVMSQLRTANSCVGVGNSALQGSSTPIAAGSFVVGRVYIIEVPGTTNFTLIGAADSNVNTVFTATGVGTGTGTARGGSLESTAVGHQALGVIVGGIRNTAVGRSAGAAVTSGNENTLVGYNAGNLITTGINNTSVGSLAGPYGTASTSCVAIGANSCGPTGDDNTAVGTSSMSGTGAGARNTAIGRSAGIQIQGSNDAVCVGWNAGADNVGTRSQCVYVGSEAGRNVLGTGNIAIGYQVGRNSNATVSNLTAIGYQSALAVTGADNTAVGYTAGTGLTTGSQNAFFGYNAGRNVSTTGGNTAIGSSAMATGVGATNATAVGWFAGNNNAGANNTYLGRDAGLLHATGSNTTVIGASAAASTTSVSNEITFGNASIATLRAQVTTITALSDARDKTDIAPLPYGIDFVMKLNPVTFTWNMRDGGKVGIKSAGFIAQELAQVEDEAGATDHLQLTYRENPDKLEAGYGHLLPVLVKALQDLKNEFDAYKAAHP